MNKALPGILFAAGLIFIGAMFCHAMAEASEAEVSEDQVSSHFLEIGPRDDGIRVVTDGAFHFPVEPYSSKGILLTGDVLVRPGDEWGERLTLKRIELDGAVFTYESLGDPSGSGELSRTSPVDMKIYWKKALGEKHGQN